MIVSPFTPLFFLGRHKRNGLPSPYTQTFATTDIIRVQIIRGLGEDEATVTLYDAESDTRVADLTKETMSQGDGSLIDNYCLTDCVPGCYYITIGEDRSEIFHIADDELTLADTILFQYSPSGLSRRDVYGDEDFYFSFRVHGGFKDGGWAFSIDNEQFVTQESDIVELYGRESTQKVLTIGSSKGVPVWFGELINRILVCRLVYIDGARYARFESSVPEKEQTLDGVSSFVFSQKLQRINYLKPYLQ